MNLVLELAAMGMAFSTSGLDPSTSPLCLVHPRGRHRHRHGGSLYLEGGSTCTSGGKYHEAISMCYKIEARSRSPCFLRCLPHFFEILLARLHPMAPLFSAFIVSGLVLAVQASPLAGRDAATPICSAWPYKIAQNFASYAPFQSFCSSKFPVAAVTVISTGSLQHPQALARTHN